MTTASREIDDALLRRIGADRIAERENKVRRRNFWSAMTFMAPAIVLVGGLLLYPVAFNIYLSLTDWRKFTGLDTFVGLKNYERLFSQIYFGQAALNTDDLGGRFADRSRGARPGDRDPAEGHPLRERLQEPDLPAAGAGADRRRRDLVLCLRALRPAQLPVVLCDRRTGRGRLALSGQYGDDVDHRHPCLADRRHRHGAAAARTCRDPARSGRGRAAWTVPSLGRPIST